MMLASVLVLALVGSSQCFIFDWSADKWDALKVHWGVNPKGSQNYVYQPLTTKDAISQGYKKVSECDVNANWRGARYVKNDDYTTILLFDVNGYIAGIQTAVPSGGTYPPPHERPPFVKDGNRWVISAYFTDPTKICKEGRSAEQFKEEVTGTNLYIQNGTNAETDIIRVPHREKDIGHTMWTKGKCFYTMGTHYWYNTSEDMDCDDFFPVFLMYNSGELTGFGWAMGVNIESKLVEHPGSLVLPLFFKEVPQCLKEYDTLTTQHIYLTKNWFINLKC